MRWLIHRHVRPRPTSNGVETPLLVLYNTESMFRVFHRVVDNT